MKQKITLFFFLIFVSMLSAQGSLLDSLQHKVNETSNEIDRARLYNRIANEYKYSDPNKMLEYGEKALELAKKNTIKSETGTAHLNIGVSYIIVGNYQNAMDHFMWAKSIFEDRTISEGDTEDDLNEGVAKTYGYMGVVFSEQSNYSKALQFYLKSATLYEKSNNEVQCSKIYNNIGVVYKSQHQDKKALEYYLKAYKIQEKLKDPNAGITLTNIANIYCDQKEYDIAFEYYTSAKNSIDTHPNARALGEWYNNIGAYYNLRGRKDLAKENWGKAIKTFENLNDSFGLADTHLHLSQFYFEQNNTTTALEHANKALALSKNNNVLEQQAVSEKLLSTIYSKKNNPALALAHFKNYSAVKDSLTKENDVRKAVEASMNYEFEKKELIRKENNSKRELLIKEEAKNAKMTIFYGALITLLLFGIAFLIYNRAQLKKTLTLEKELAEYEQKALHLQMNPHFVFNCLGSISSFIVQNGTDSAIKYLSKFSKLMRLTLEYSKESLIPIDKEIESLQNYLELEQLRFNNKFDFKITKGSEIEDDVALSPLLIQPFIENAIIHGVIPKREMGNITINFSVQNDSLICSIEDNGIGINKSKLNKENSVRAHKSMALDIIKKRLEMIAESTSKKATITIEELTNNTEITGTKVVLHLPLRYINE